MSAYGAIAPWYDLLTADVPYEGFADFYERVFRERGVSPGTILDLGCGTGRLARILFLRGYDIVAVDSSEDMLACAAVNLEDCRGETHPLLLCQKLSGLDLYGTVGAAVSSLDSFNYLEPEELPEIFRRLRLFIEPGGLLIFDLLTPERLKAIDGEVFIDENDSFFCVWRAEYFEDESKLVYAIDLFESEGELYRRGFEEHIEYAHSPLELSKLLRAEGFEDIELRTDGPPSGDGRVFIVARNAVRHS